MGAIDNHDACEAKIDRSAEEGRTDSKTDEVSGGGRSVADSFPNAPTMKALFGDCYVHQEGIL